MNIEHGNGIFPTGLLLIGYVWYVITIIIFFYITSSASTGNGGVSLGIGMKRCEKTIFLAPLLRGGVRKYLGGANQKGVAWLPRLPP